MNKTKKISLLVFVILKQNQYVHKQGANFLFVTFGGWKFVYMSALELIHYTQKPTVNKNKK